MLSVLVRALGASFVTASSPLPRVLEGATDAGLREKKEKAQQAAERAPRPTFTAGVFTEFSGDFGAASLAVTRGRTGIDAPLATLGAWRLGADLATEWSWYDFDSFPDGSGGRGAPMSHGHSTLLGATAIRPFGDGWSALVRPFVASIGDSDADFGDTLLVGGFATVGKQVTPELSLALGAFAMQEFEDDPVVLPIDAILGRTVEVLDADGDKVFDEDGDASAFAGLTFTTAP